MIFYCNFTGPTCMHPSETFLDHAARKIFLYNIGIICNINNIKSVICDMRTVIYEMKSDLCDMGNALCDLDALCNMRAL